MRYCAALLILLALTLMAAPSWSVPDSPMPVSPQSAQSGETPGETAYNAGLQLIEKADRSSATGDDPAVSVYTEARAQFAEATRLEPDMPGAWNMLGYSERKLGNYDAALVAYGRALSLRPNYVEAIEYRGEAYLGLNRVADAKRTYLDLFTMNRELSDTFLEAMKQWIAARTTAPGGVDAATIRDLDQWVHERTRIAAKTSALTREGAAASWR